MPLNAAQQANQSATPSGDVSPVQLGAVQQSHQLAPPPLARFARASPVSLVPLVPLVPPVSLEPLVSRASLESPALLAQSPNLAESPQSRNLLAPLALPSLSLAPFPSHLQYASQYSKSAPRVASTVVVPPAPQLATTSALYAPALPALSQLATRPQLVPLLSEAAAMQPEFQIGALPAVSAYSYEQAEAQLASCVQLVDAA